MPPIPSCRKCALAMGATLSIFRATDSDFMRRRSSALLVIAMAGAAILGCSPSAADLNGVIKINGQAPQLTALEIMFLTPQGRLISAAVNPDGTYKARG